MPLFGMLMLKLRKHILRRCRNWHLNGGMVSACLLYQTLQLTIDPVALDYKCVHVLVFLFDRRYSPPHFLDNLLVFSPFGLLLRKCKLVTVHSLPPCLLVFLEFGLELRF